MNKVMFDLIWNQKVIAPEDFNLSVEQWLDNILRTLG